MCSLFYKVCIICVLQTVDVTKVTTTMTGPTEAMKVSVALLG